LNSKVFKILAIGDIVGKPGRQIIQSHLNEIKHKYNIDFVIANGENSAGGFGITAKIYRSLIQNGIDVVTTGNHIWKNKDIFETLDKENNILRPMNYPDNLPGKGYNIFNKNGIRILVINLMGRINILAVDCPFKKIENFLQTIDRDSYDISIIDFHAETTSEKNAMGWFLDGQVNAVYGTHIHVQTADERILPEGTAFISDIGMTGSFNSIIGMDKDNILHHFLTRMPIKYKIATENVGINGVIISVEKSSFKTISIERLKYFPE